MSTRRLVAATLTLALAAPAVAFADPPTPEATVQARSHYKQGKAYQEAGAYDQAIAEYLEADRLAPRPELYFNIAQCHRLAGHAEDAVGFYRRFVQAMPEAAGADEARMYIAQLEQQVKAERARKEAEKPAPRPVPLVPPPPQPAEQGRPALRWIGVGSAVTGAALIGVGAYFGSRAADEGDALHDAQVWTADLDEREQAAKTDETRMWILVGGGSALVLGGAALWWWGGKGGKVEAVPAVSSDRAGIVVRGTFR